MDAKLYQSSHESDNSKKQTETKYTNPISKGIIRVSKRPAHTGNSNRNPSAANDIIDNLK